MYQIEQPTLELYHVWTTYQWNWTLWSKFLKFFPLLFHLDLLCPFKYWIGLLERWNLWQIRYENIVDPMILKILKLKAISSLFDRHKQSASSKNECNLINRLIQINMQSHSNKDLEPATLHSVTSRMGQMTPNDGAGKKKDQTKVELWLVPYHALIWQALRLSSPRVSSLTNRN